MIRADDDTVDVSPPIFNQFGTTVLAYIVISVNIAIIVPNHQDALIEKVELYVEPAQKL